MNTERLKNFKGETVVVDDNILTDLLAVNNDKPVRDICKKYDIKVTGTLGIIISAYENEIIEFSQLKDCLEFLFPNDSSCYLSNSFKKIS